MSIIKSNFKPFQEGVVQEGTLHLEGLLGGLDILSEDKKADFLAIVQLNLQHLQQSGKSAPEPRNLWDTVWQVATTEVVETLALEEGSLASITKVTHANGLKYICKAPKVKFKRDHDYEIKILFCIPPSEFVIKFFGVNQQNHILLEYGEGGDLLQLIIHLGITPASPKQRLSIIEDVFHGIAYLNDHDIVHRDLKPANVILMTKIVGSEITPRAKITDFNLACQLPSGVQELPEELVAGTLEILAPEYAQQKTSRLGKAAHKATLSRVSDVWSAGQMLGYLITQKWLNECDNYEDVYSYFSRYPLKQEQDMRSVAVEGVKKLAIQYPDDAAVAQLGKLLQSCLFFDPQNRPSARNILMS